jgi:acyl dehydratase
MTLTIDGKPPEGLITDASIEAARSLIGKYLRPDGPFLQKMNEDTMRNFANGIGDRNPLFRDIEYGRYSRYGSLVGHPIIPISYGYIGRGRVGFPGVHAFFAGNDWEFFRTWRPGDQVLCVERIVDIVEKSSQLSGKLILQYTEGTFFNQRDELVARCLGWCTRHERKASRESGKNAPKEPYRYEVDEMAKIDEQVMNEPNHVRGGEVRYWQDVVVGEELTPIVRGPLSLMDIGGFSVGVGRGLTHGLILDAANRHPGHYFRSKEAGGAIEYTGVGHRRDTSAHLMGVSSGYDVGPARVGWMATLVTNWVGDHGYLKRLRAEVRDFNLIGDTTFCKGKVTKKYVENGVPLVDLEIWGENQYGKITTPGLATVMLPSRDLAHSLVIDGSKFELNRARAS